MRTRICCTIICYLLLAITAFATEPCATQNGTFYPLTDKELTVSYWQQSATLHDGVCTYEGPLEINFPADWTLHATRWTFTNGTVLSIDWEKGQTIWEKGRFDGEISLVIPKHQFSFPNGFRTLTVTAVRPGGTKPFTRTYTSAQLLAGAALTPTRVTWLAATKPPPLSAEQ